MKRESIKTVILLHVMLMIYSLGGIFSKEASKELFFSKKFCICYALIIALLFFYAIGWQQIIKRIPLTSAFANKAITIVWGMVWGVLFFHESVTIGKIAGAILVIIGVVLYARTNEKLDFKRDNSGKIVENLQSTNCFQEKTDIK